MKRIALHAPPKNSTWPTHIILARGGVVVLCPHGQSIYSESQLALLV